jgi:1-acyl-sn-glycerol-3-phosphate acyltransferase
MLILRSLLFNAMFYLTLMAWMIVCLPSFLVPRRLFMPVMRQWAQLSLWLMRVIVGTKVEFRGREHIPPGALLVACKHQSTWETFALLTVFDDPAYVLKRELMWIPLFGWYAWKGGQIPVDRAKGTTALRNLRRRTQEEVRQRRQVIIFPEGTRRAPGAPPDYKVGVALLHQAMGVPCLPVALNSGLYWPRRKLIRRPGTIIVEFLPPLRGVLPRGSLLPMLQASIEGATERLLAEGRAELGFAAEPAPAPPGAPASPAHEEGA